MWLSPYPTSIYQPNSLATMLGGPQTAHFSETQCHELPTLEFAGKPFPRILMPSLTASTLMQRRLGANSSCNIGSTRKARRTRVGRIGCNWDTTNTTQNLHHLRGGGIHCRSRLWIFHPESFYNQLPANRIKVPSQLNGTSIFIFDFPPSVETLSSPPRKEK